MRGIPFFERVQGVRSRGGGVRRQTSTAALYVATYGSEAHCRMPEGVCRYGDTRQNVNVTLIPAKRVTYLSSSFLWCDLTHFCSGLGLLLNMASAVRRAKKARCGPSRPMLKFRQ